MIAEIRKLKSLGCSLLLCTLLCSGSLADGPADNASEVVRQIPPAGMEIPAEDRASLEEGYAKLLEKLNQLRSNETALTKSYLPDVEIFEKAIRVALKEDGFFSPNDVRSAHKVLELGTQRADALLTNDIPTDLVLERDKPFQTVRGFRSAIDGSVQPYGVYYAPKKFATDAPSTLLRGDVWCRGRSEKGLEMQFLAQHSSGNDTRPAPGVLMIYPFGRYCNANKLAGEVDTLEAIEHALDAYPIDPKGVAIRGFSMGGAAAWHLAVHYPDRWFAATPGAGFSETPRFLDVFQKEKLEPRDFESTLWRLYDCPLWVNNLRNVPTIAYSGELDKQKQAADVMAEASWNQSDAEKFELTHIIGPKTAHRIERGAGEEIERRLQKIYEARNERTPPQIDFTTYTLKYNRCYWLTIDALQEHWTKARVRGSLNDGRIFIRCEGVASFSLDLDIDTFPSELESILVIISSGEPTVVNLDRTTFRIKRRSDRSFHAKFEIDPSNPSAWSVTSPLSQDKIADQLVKKSGLQGPIDDAFMGPFLFVKPTANGQHQEVDQWVQREFDRAVREWHRQMRGDVRVVTADKLVEADYLNYNVVLWGDPKSNPKVAEVLATLPLQWSESTLKMATHSVDSANHVPVLIYPNPLNPDRYIVLNSGLTYREYDYLNNARQVPKLPDWAIVNVREKVGPRWPGQVIQAGFFDEKWQWK